MKIFPGEWTSGCHLRGQGRLRLSFKSSDKFSLLPRILRGNDPLHHSLLRRQTSHPGEGHCPYCKKNTKELHQTKFVSVRDLAISGQPVYLKVPRRRFYCRFCQRYVTERLDFIPWRSAQTKRYEDNVYQRVLSSSIEQVSREESLSTEEPIL